MSVLHFTSQDFEKEVLQSDVPVLIDFWADWCGPCKAYAPVVEEIAEKYAGKLKVGKVNVDEQRELAKEYRIFSIPTVVVIKNGEVKARNSGLMSAEETEGLIKEAQA